ncbi:MAG: DNA polymerase III subunit chi [Rhodospirillales bacterium]|nr:DNA polymerase III subunit chi [Rhodospirillales bacterium]
MAEIGFYHLTRSSVAEALGQLLGRTLAAGQRAVVRLRDADAVAAFDRALWEVQEPPFLPHGSAASGDAALQPIWLTATDEVANGAKFLFLPDGAETALIDRAARIFDLFDGKDPAAVAAARERWRAARAGGHSPVYWRQGARGWERQG